MPSRGSGGPAGIAPGVRSRQAGLLLPLRLQKIHPTPPIYYSLITYNPTRASRPGRSPRFPGVPGWGSPGPLPLLGQGQPLIPQRVPGRFPARRAIPRDPGPEAAPGSLAHPGHSLQPPAQIRTNCCTACLYFFSESSPRIGLLPVPSRPPQRRATQDGGTLHGTCIAGDHSATTPEAQPQLLPGQTGCAWRGARLGEPTSSPAHDARAGPAPAEQPGAQCHGPEPRPWPLRGTQPRTRRWGHLRTWVCTCSRFSSKVLGSPSLNAV
ncbi:uncharacterized protein LOC113970577 isoform X2 [Neopelma chrysocephalum]|uniref:uncharacterized protein LOC113970577 isoform X2 n=1 Tax=Neopelma chrysocephalum TaxID=114329 RepID=UPI000FCD3296|nr:uncharacterized protein LOC113970577 isoform X2 [Neopelma chrysocephalum]